MQELVDRAVAQRSRLMRYGLAATMFLAAAAKFFEPIIWGSYTPPWVAAMLPVGLVTWMHVVSVGEVALALGILTRRWGHIAAFLTGLWLFSITAVTAAGGSYDIAVRDFGLTLYAFSVALVLYEGRTG
ncbi:MAG: hypothetical protein SV186_02735 [Candidatus Nanohaloarchaea archaeon]|nr:hypothetical protein [Candidatus Nanohaloarchaea archaeon]